MSRDSHSLPANPRSIFFWNLSLFFQLFAIAGSTFLPLFWLSLDYSESSVARIDSFGFFLSLLGPLISVFFLPRFSYRIFVTLSLLLSGIFSLLMFLGSQFYVQLGSFVITLLGMGISATVVPLSVIVMLSAGSFGYSYGAYRRIGSYGFLLGLMLSGYGSDVFGAYAYPLLVAIGFIGAGISFFMIDMNQNHPVFHEKISIKNFFVSSDLVYFGLSQLVVWSSLGICFRFLPLRMAQMGSSSLMIGITVSSYGIFALFTIRWVGGLCDRIKSGYLWASLPFSLFLRILFLYIPESNYIWFIPIQILHVPTWVLNDILVVKYLQEKREALGALNISALTQLGMILGLASGSFLMSLALPLWGLRDSFIVLSFLPLVFYPVFVTKLIRG